eukprot:TRINITY_DN41371_c0_g1_i1.p2 TRINITY_DN41371_c0_g1~~TRINITY_DN41371_c0_g1_i1.p2  ORF type:complete len:120 (+),score=1.91 TRINITY_DN41371_c0_g1_i1:156-515(+)
MASAQQHHSVARVLGCGGVGVTHGGPPHPAAWRRGWPVWKWVGGRVFNPFVCIVGLSVGSQRSPCIVPCPFSLYSTRSPMWCEAVAPPLLQAPTADTAVRHRALQAAKGRMCVCGNHVL